MEPRNKRVALLVGMMVALLSALVVLPAAAVTTLNYSSYLGGTAADITRYSIAVDSSGNIYLTGYTDSTDFPTIPGAYQTTYGGGDYDAFVSKFNSSGNLIYSTYFGGAGKDYGYSIAVDDTGNIYISGFTSSTNFPTTAGAYKTTYGGGSYDAFVSKFNSSGNLVYSTYLGGSAMECATGIVVDDMENIYVTGYTQSTDFPTTPGAYDTTKGVGTDAFVSEFNSSGNLVYSTYLGGKMQTGDDCAIAITVGDTGSFYITGYTNSMDFPTTPGAYQTTKAGVSNSQDAFVSEFNSSGNLVYSTYLGGSGIDYGYSIAVDDTGNFYIAGYTHSSDFPTTPGAYQTTRSGPNDFFVARFNSSGDLTYSTYFGGSSMEYGNGMVVDDTGNFSITGYTESTDFPTTAGAYQTTSGGDDDAFVTGFDSSGNLAYSTYLGGSAMECATGIVVDDVENIYVVGFTESTDFPTTAGAYQTTYGGGDYDAFFARFTVVEAPTAAFTADVTSGTTPLTVNFTDQSTNTPTSWAWDFENDGTVDSTDQNPVYNYTSAGTYTVKLNVTNAYGSDEEVKTDYIMVTGHGVCGDVNNDGKLTMGDGRLIYLHVIYGEPLANTWAADVNDDDKLTMGDGRLVYLHVIYGAEEYPLNCGS